MMSSEEKHALKKAKKAERHKSEDNGEKKSKKRKHDSDDESNQGSSKATKSAHSTSEGNGSSKSSGDYFANQGISAGETQRRARTRSMSESEEQFKLDPTQSLEEFQSAHQITVSGSQASGSGPFICPQPMQTFDSTPFAPPIRRAFDAAGYVNPTPTQAQSWPIALLGRDIITVAKTGSGTEIILNNLYMQHSCEF